MGAVEQLVYAELQARIIRNKYSPSPEERETLEKCRSKALRSAFFGGGAAAVIAWLFLSRPLSTSWGALGLLRFNLWRQSPLGRNGGGWQSRSSGSVAPDSLGRSGFGETGGSPSSGPAADAGPHPEGSQTLPHSAASRVTRADRAPAWRRGVLVTCGTLIGAYYGAQRTGTYCLEDLLALGPRSAMANEIRFILQDAKQSLELVGSSPNYSSTAAESGELADGASSPELAANEDAPMAGPGRTGAGLLTERAMKILQQSIRRDEIEHWLRQHDTTAPFDNDQVSLEIETPWQLETDRASGSAWHATDAPGTLSVEDTPSARAEDSLTVGFGRSRPDGGAVAGLRPRIGPSLLERPVSSVAPKRREAVRGGELPNLVESQVQSRTDILSASDAHANDGVDDSVEDQVPGRVPWSVQTAEPKPSLADEVRKAE
jgi:hypothetical protein